MRLGDNGEGVRQLQLSLTSFGYDLPRFGADGDFGRETARALEDFARDRGIGWAPGVDVPPALIAALRECSPPPIAPVCVTTTSIDDPLDVPLYDLRSEASDPHPKSKVRRGKTVRRSPKAINAIVLHQTDVEFGGQHGLPLARRSLRVACHAMAFDGFLAWAAPLDYYIYHADRLNATTLGLEVDGVFPGLVGRKPTKGRKATVLSDARVNAACAGVRLLVTEGRRLGCPIEFIYAHRQADSWRRADPGQELWERVVLEYAVPNLGLKTRPDYTLPNANGPKRKGLPIPREWDPEGVGRY